jgi:mycothiol system anti-sigma-R factor
MNPCHEYSAKTLLYLDKALAGPELEEFRIHLDSCSNCREYVEAEEALSHLLHRSRPLYSAPDALRSRVSAATVSHRTANGDIERTHQRVFQELKRLLSGNTNRLPGFAAPALAALVIGLCLAIFSSAMRQARAANYVEAAVAQHRSYLNGTLEAGLRSSSPELVTAWFAGKVPFDFRLPTPQAYPENKPTYQLTGARLVEYNGNHAALVTYESSNDKISLLVAASKVAVVAGGDEVLFRNLTFHYRTSSGFKVITWSNHGLSYALVYSASGPARSSCLVCHQNMADNRSFSDPQ